MTTWNVVNPNTLLPAVLVSAVKAASSALSGALAELAAVSLPTLPSLPGLPDVTPTVVNAILDTLSAMLKGGRVHILTVPITKSIPPPAIPPLPPTLDDLQAALNITLGPSNTSAASTYASLVAKAGGNSGFFNTFAQAIMDPLDPNRPQYDNQSDAVAMAVILIGAPNFGSIVSAASMLEVLTQPTGGNSFAARTVPVPQNLVAKVAGASSPPGVGVSLSWDAPAGAFSSPFFPQIGITVQQYAIIRSTDAKVQSARSVLDLFSTQTLTEGMTSGNATVVSIGSGTNSSYLDVNAELDPTQPVYYCVAWSSSAREPSGTSTLPFDRLSNVVKVSVKAPSPPQTGTSPDWIATTSALDAFPSIELAAQSLIEQTRALLVPTASSSSRLNDAMKLSQSASARLSARATDLINDVSRLSAALSRPVPSMYVTQMSSGTGGNGYLLAELSKRLGDPTDPSRPPFDHGEYVCGVCLVAGAPRLADLAATLAFFEALFGASSPNPLEGLLVAIDTAITSAETVVFQQNMQPFPAGTDTSGIDPSTGKPTVSPTVTIGPDGTPVGTNDPNNPNAGNTNVTPTSELC